SNMDLNKLNGMEAKSSGLYSHDNSSTFAGLSRAGAADGAEGDDHRRGDRRCLRAAQRDGGWDLVAPAQPKTKVKSQERLLLNAQSSASRAHSSTKGLIVRHKVVHRLKQF